MSQDIVRTEYGLSSVAFVLPGDMIRPELCSNAPAGIIAKIETVGIIRRITLEDGRVYTYGPGESIEAAIQFQ